jgi:hypothetical protein
MKKHPGGTEVRPGFYWNLGAWSIATVSRKSGTLPGGPEHRYVKVPAPMLLLLAPMMGGLYVMFLPFIGFAVVLSVAGTKVARALERAFAGLVATVSPAWQPGEAYFAGKHEGERAGTGEGEAATPLEGLEREVEAKRQGEATPGQR